MDLDQFLADMRDRISHMLGYPINATNCVSAEALKPFLGIVLNNLGDPFEGSTYAANTFKMEQEVIAYLATLFHLPIRDAWGYVTASGSEGNWRGLSLGMKKYPDAVVYCSEKVHYSAMNACKMMRLQPVIIPCDANHALSVPRVEAMLDNSRPAVFCLTAGTTMAGAIDPIADVARILQDSQIPHYIHVDAALSGFILPFLSGVPVFDFVLPIDSLSVSGHKMLGCPFACGVFITHKRNRPGGEIEYIGSANTTLFGSRNGLAPLAIWYSLKKLDLPKIVEKCIKSSRTLLCRLRAIGWSSWQNEFANTVMLGRPSCSLIAKYQLSVEDKWAHVIVMPHVTNKLLDEFLFDLKGVSE